MNLESLQIFKALSAIILDIEGSNLTNTGWFPTDSDREYMSDDSFQEAKKEAELKDSKVLFKNVFIDWDSCDCNDGMCSHGSYVYQITVTDGNKKHEFEIDDDGIRGYNDNKSACIPPDGTVYDFYRMCELIGIKLEFSDYAKSLINERNTTPELLNN